MSEYAYMHDLTERGVDVDENQVNSLIYMDQPQLTPEQQQSLMTPIDIGDKPPSEQSPLQ